MTTSATITDPLPELIEQACSAVRELLEDWFIENGQLDAPNLSDLDSDGRVHKAIDSAIPLDTRTLNAFAYFNGPDALAALESEYGPTEESAWPSGALAAGCYQLIKEGVYTWYEEESRDLVDRWNEAAYRPEALRAAVRIVREEDNAATLRRASVPRRCSVTKC